MNDHPVQEVHRELEYTERKSLGTVCMGREREREREGGMFMVNGLAVKGKVN